MSGTAAHGVHFSWIYGVLGRYREEGEAGPEPRSRRPKHSPSATPFAIEDEPLRHRGRDRAPAQAVAEDGLDAGAQTICVHLERRHGAAPLPSTVMRILRRRGLVVPQPRKRPKSSLQRFEASLPNECWQSDMAHWSLAGGRHVEIVNFIDDHGRLCVASVALAVTKTTDVVRVFHRARDRYGTPASVFSDNGAIYTGKYRLGQVLFECELERLGVVAKHSRPNHPQTCGKVERFHQTLKKFLARQDPVRTIAGLQAQIDRFVAYYNTTRPHRSLNRRTPQETFDAQVKAHPAKAYPDVFCRIRHDRVDFCGKLTVRYEGQLRHIGMGAPFKGLRVVVLVAGPELRVLSTGGDLLRTLTLDPARDYQPQSMGWTSTMSRLSIRRRPDTSQWSAGR